MNSWTVSAKAIAVVAGGPAKALNVMFVLDTTASMASTTDDTGCAVPNISSPKKLDCAKYGIQLILKQLNPAIDKVGVMAFPGMSKNWIPCTGSPSIEPYGTSGIIYQINGTTLSTDYATTIGKLNDSSALVQAVGDNVNKLTGCLSAPGGEGTFYAEAISAAQSALVAEGSPTAQNVIIFLSDGEANQVPADGKMDATYALTACSPSANCSPGHQVQQCNQAVKNAASATAAGTWVYVLAYDAATATGATIPYAGGSSGTGCSQIYPGGNIAASGVISNNSTTIAMQNISNYPWVANLGGGATCSGCNVYDSSTGRQIGTISSWTGTTITLKARASNNGQGASDNLLIQSRERRL